MDLPLQMPILNEAKQLQNGYLRSLLVTGEEGISFLEVCFIGCTVNITVKNDFQSCRFENCKIIFEPDYWDKSTSLYYLSACHFNNCEIENFPIYDISWGNTQFDSMFENLNNCSDDFGRKVPYEEK